MLQYVCEVSRETWKKGVAVTTPFIMRLAR